METKKQDALMRTKARHAGAEPLLAKLQNPVIYDRRTDGNGNRLYELEIETKRVIERHSSLFVGLIREEMAFSIARAEEEARAEIEANRKELDS